MYKKQLPRSQAHVHLTLNIRGTRQAQAHTYIQSQSLPLNKKIMFLIVIIYKDILPQDLPYDLQYFRRTQPQMMV